MRKILTALAAVVLMAGCGSPDGSEEYIEKVRANKMAQAYDDKALKSIYKNLCMLQDGDRDRIMDNYSELTSRERVELVDISTGLC